MYDYNVYPVNANAIDSWNAKLVVFIADFFNDWMTDFTILSYLACSLLFLFVFFSVWQIIIVVVDVHPGQKKNNTQFLDGFHWSLLIISSKKTLTSLWACNFPLVKYSRPKVADRSSLESSFQFMTDWVLEFNRCHIKPYEIINFTKP